MNSFRTGTTKIGLATCLWMTCGCTTVRNTDPPRTATEQFLLSVAATDAVRQLAAESIRGRRVFVDNTYLPADRGASAEVTFMLAELRAYLLQAGIQLAPKREDAQIVVEVRSGGLGIDRYEFLIGIPALPIGSALTAATGTTVPISTPELALIKNTRQWGAASIAFVAYWADTGELIASSGPTIGRSHREDWWFFGMGPRSISDIPTTQPLE